MLKALGRIICAITLIFAFSLQAVALNPDEVLDNPVLEERARELSKEIRCLVCQNQSIDDSDAQLAKDLRVLVREQLVEGKSDQEILDFLVLRYGEFVLLKPQFTIQNMILWVLPLIAFIGGIFLIRGLFKKRDEEELTPSVEALSDAEKDELAKILKK